MLGLFRVTPVGSRTGHLHDAQAAVLVMVVMLAPIARIVPDKVRARLWAHARLNMEWHSMGEG